MLGCPYHFDSFCMHFILVSSTERLNLQIENLRCVDLTFIISSKYIGTTKIISKSICKWKFTGVQKTWVNQTLVPSKTFLFQPVVFLHRRLVSEHSDNRALAVKHHETSSTPPWHILGNAGQSWATA